MLVVDDVAAANALSHALLVLGPIFPALALPLARQLALPVARTPGDPLLLGVAVLVDVVAAAHSEAKAAAHALLPR